MKMRVEIRVMPLEAEECQSLSANHQKPGGRRGADPLSQPQKEPALPSS